MGDIFVWLMDDDRKRIVKMELRIKIGRLVAKVRRME